MPSKGESEWCTGTALGRTELRPRTVLSAKLIDMVQILFPVLVKLVKVMIKTKKLLDFSGTERAGSQETYEQHLALQLIRR